jgi:murein L,D-transpeptidase YcbB/YkuD
MTTWSTARAFSTVALVAAIALGVGCNRVDPNEHVDEMRALVSRTPRWATQDALGKRLWAVEQQFYEERGYRPAWVDGDRTTSRMKDLIQQLKYSERHGLDPADYAVAEFDAARERSQTKTGGTRFYLATVPELDARLTWAYLQYAADLLGWRRSARQVNRQWLASPRNEDLLARLRTAVDKDEVRDSLEALAPTHPQYKGLQAALARKEDPSRIQQIRMNLERWRWAPHDLGERYILINVPAYQMQVVEGGEPVLAMRVIVGKPDWPTPLFSDEMTYVVFSPYWNIPENILRDETLPRLVDDPDYLSRNNIEVVGTSGEVVDPTGIDWADTTGTTGLRFRQTPGPENALGLVKFVFPNHFNVYLHDTPNDRLFNRPQRTLSHGCIRVEKPVALAEYVLHDQPQWTAERIAAAMHAHREQTAKLESPLPVHIGYWTAWVEEDGRVTFTDDPYGIDRTHAQLIKPLQTRPATKAD